APAPAGKTHQHDRRSPPTHCLGPGETHTRLSKKDRKLPCQASGPRPEHEIHLAKGSLATRPRFSEKPHSQPKRCRSVCDQMCRRFGVSIGPPEIYAGKQ